MHNNKKKILVIVFRFPPMGGVCSKRWVKLAKYLTRKNYQVHILTIKYPYKDKINWSSDIEGNGNIIIHRIKARYPVWYFKSKKYFLSKIIGAVIKRIYNFSFRLIDKGERFGKSMLPYAKKLVIREEIQNVVVTAPFHSLNYFAAILKTECPNINLILDYQDPWNNHRKYEFLKAFRSFKLKRKSVEMEYFSLNIADKIVGVTEIIRLDLIDTYHLPENKISYIPLGFDKEDSGELKIKGDFEKFNMIYLGELGITKGSRLEGIKVLSQAIYELNDDFINNNFIINFYTSKKNDYFNDFQYVNIIRKHFNFYDFVPYEKTSELINEHFCCLSINAPIDKYAIGTKVFEYMALGKKIFHIANGGCLYDLLEKKNQYVTDYNLENVKNTLLRLKEAFIKKDFYPTDYSEFEMEKITKQVEELFVFK
ncbi:MAG: glycosyltransferase [Ignavibacteriales bacterium]|nr:glycosyltransferase [Ignavibacteriales bacterium]